MTAISTLYSIMLINVDGFGRQPDEMRAASRRQVREAVGNVLGSLRLRAEDVPDGDMADGVLFLIPPSVSAVRLVSTFADTLNGELRARAESMRLLLALHCDQAGSNGDELARHVRDLGPTDQARGIRLTEVLVAARALRESLRAATRAHVAVIVSDETYKAISGDAYRRIDTAAFLPVPLDAGEFGEVRGWVTVPGYPAPPGIDTPNVGQFGAGGANESGADRAGHAWRAAQEADHMLGGHGNILVTGGQVGALVGRDQHVHGDLIFGSKPAGTEHAEPPP